VLRHQNLPAAQFEMVLADWIVDSDGLAACLLEQQLQVKNWLQLMTLAAAVAAGICAQQAPATLSQQLPTTPAIVAPLQSAITLSVQLED
jgi:hypothetical protein